MDFDITKLTKAQIDKIQDGINKYNLIMDEFKSNFTPLGKNCGFKRMFNGFYRVRRGSKWQTDFYDIFERNRTNKTATFAGLYNEVLKAIDKREKSFVSKMFNKINDSSPIIDKNVLNWLKINGLKIKEKDPVAIYDALNKRYQDDLIPKAGSAGFFDAFDKEFPDGKGISEVKKIDFHLWAYFAKK